MTPVELEHAFEVYFAEIERCVRNKCYWALLHLLVILPDICAALQADDGEADDGRYRNWCRQNFPGDKTFTPEDRYAIRCTLLHQGRTITSRGQYGSFSFVQPTDTGSVFHRLVTDFGAGIGPNLTLDVGKMAEETGLAIRRWFDDLQKPEKKQRLKNVQTYLPQLVRTGKKSIPGITGIQTSTVSSTGSITTS